MTDKMNVKAEHPLRNYYYKFTVLPGRGEVAIAARSHACGSLVMTDEAHITWYEADGDESSARNITIRLAALIKDVRAKKQMQLLLTAFAHYPLESTPRLTELMDNWRAKLATLPSSITGGLTTNELAKLLLVARVHAREQHGQKHGHFGIFGETGRVAHSCQPNTIRYEVGNRCILVALKEIAAGEEITVSQLPDPLHLIFTTVLRRRILDKERSIICRCPSCDNPYDDMSVWYCDAPACKRPTLKLYHPPGMAEATMRCESCHATPTKSSMANKLKNTPMTDSYHVLQTSSIENPAEWSQEKAQNSAAVLGLQRTMVAREHSVMLVFRYMVCQRYTVPYVDIPLHLAESFRLACWLHSQLKNNPVLMASFSSGCIDPLFLPTTQGVSPGLDVAKVVEIVRDFRAIFPEDSLDKSLEERRMRIDKFLAFQKRNCTYAACKAPFADKKRLLCTACKSVWYCSSDCQLADWKSQDPSHKTVCKITIFGKTAIAGYNSQFPALA